MVNGSGDEEAQLRREHRRVLAERLDANDEYLRKLEEQRREAGQLSEEELAREIEFERERNRREPGSIAGGGRAGLHPRHPVVHYSTKPPFHILHRKPVRRPWAPAC